MAFDVANDRLRKNGRPVEFAESPNHGGRIMPSLIVLHDTASTTREGTVSWFLNPRSRVSAHLVVGPDGTVTQMIPFDVKGWHAGRSTWRGRDNVNGWSIGIEIVNPGLMTKRGGMACCDGRPILPIGECQFIETATHGAGWWKAYTPEQLAAVEGIITALKRAYPAIMEVVGHHDICVPKGRKVDPTPLMQWTRMRAALQLTTTPESQQLAHETMHIAQARLTELSYGPGKVGGHPGPKFQRAVLSFQAQNGLTPTGTLDRSTVATLHSPDAKPFPTGEFEDVPVEKVIAESRTAKEASAGITKAQLTIAGSVITMILSTFEAISNSITKLASNPVGAVLLVAGGVGVLYGLMEWRRSGKILGFRVDDHQTGENVGGSK